MDSRTNIDKISRLSDIFMKYTVTDHHHKRDHVGLAAQKREATCNGKDTFRGETKRHFCWSVRARSIDWSIINFKCWPISKI